MMSDRNNAKRYLFGAALASVALGGVPSLIHKAKAQQATAADFTFETSANGYSGLSTFSTSAKTSGTSVTASSSSVGTTYGFTGSKIGPLAAESGAGTAFGVHAATNTAWSFPSGNGSQHALSATVWAPGDYYEFDVPTIGIQNIVISFDQVSSGTGPGQFNLVAIDGTGSSTYTVGGYTLISTPSSGTSFQTGATNTVAHYAFSLSSFSAGSAFNNNSSAVFELVDATSVNLTGGSVGAAGTDRVDNFLVAGDTVVSTPEPSSIALAGIGVASLLLRRKVPKRQA